MGMAATQARYLAAIARQTNLEYQGQQINQERTILSQQCTALYNSLLAMQVPTPPSTQDYTTVQYAGTIGATNYSFDASSIKPSSNGNYIVTVQQEAYGDSLQKNSGIAAVSFDAGAGSVTVSEVPTTFEEETTLKSDTVFTAASTNEVPSAYMVLAKTLPNDNNVSNYYVLDGNNYRIATSSDLDNESGGEEKTFYQKSTTQPTDSSGAVAVKNYTETFSAGVQREYTASELSTLWVVDGGTLTTITDKHVELDPDTGFYTVRDGYTLYSESELGSNYSLNGAVPNCSVNGHAIYELEDADITDDQRMRYKDAIANSGLTKPNGDPYQPSDFYIYFDDEGETCFVLKTDINDNNNNARTYAYIANGSYNKQTTYDDCKLTFDPSTGRITEVAFPNYAANIDENGDTVYDYSVIDSWTTMDVSASTVTDEIAYQDAYAQYEYEQYQYDKTQQEINAKTEIIQQQDRNLELKLQRLDNERTMITTEIDAMEKVIDENIESSFKTFSG